MSASRNKGISSDVKWYRNPVVIAVLLLLFFPLGLALMWFARAWTFPVRLAISAAFVLAVAFGILAPKPKGFERDCLEYRGKHDELTRRMSKNVYLYLTFGNVENRYAVWAFFGDENGESAVIGLIGLYNSFSGKYFIENDQLSIDWEDAHEERAATIIEQWTNEVARGETLPKRLKLIGAEPSQKRLSTAVRLMLDAQTNVDYQFQRAWDLTFSKERTNIITGSDKEVPAEDRRELERLRSIRYLPDGKVHPNGNALADQQTKPSESEFDQSISNDSSSVLHSDVLGRWVVDAQDCEYDGGLFVEMINGKLAIGCHEWSPHILEVTRTAGTYTLKLSDRTQGELSVTMKLVEGGMEVSESLRQMCYGQSASRLVKCP